MWGAGRPIWHVAGQRPARMMNSGSCADSGVADIPLQVDFIFLLQCTLCLKKPSGRFAIHTNTSYISSSRSTEVDGSSRQVCAFFFFLSPFSLLISAANIGVRATRPSPQDPPPSAPATASTSVAAMREARNLQDVSLPICMVAHALIVSFGCMSLWGCHA